uniref:CBM21 domain-containing protein n=1 Tax=Globodera pallida TaxID=36090 RepID=A0A183CRC2_GLOPA
AYDALLKHNLDNLKQRFLEYCVKTMKELPTHKYIMEERELLDNFLPNIYHALAIQKKMGLEAGEEQHRQTWKMAFKQPVSEYVRFRDTLDRQRVALENVVLNNKRHCMAGTIKVANIAFEKRVFVRYTANGWETFADVRAKWQCSPSKEFDTFCFDVPLPRSNNTFSRIEFCVCFVAGSSSCEEAHWDSNGGKNFDRLTRPIPNNNDTDAEDNACGVHPNDKKSHQQQQLSAQGHQPQQYGGNNGGTSNESKFTWANRGAGGPVVRARVDVGHRDQE